MLYSDVVQCLKALLKDEGSAAWQSSTTSLSRQLSKNDISCVFSALINSSGLVAPGLYLFYAATEIQGRPKVGLQLVITQVLK